MYLEDIFSAWNPGGPTHMSRGLSLSGAQDRRKVCRFIQKALGLKLQRLREKGRKKDPWFLALQPHEI